MRMKEYDLIVPLGGSCAVSYQLKERGLRRVALPFDWLFSMSAKTLHNLAQSFVYGFDNWLKEGNLVPLQEEERRVGGAKYQYRDLATDYAFIHDFLHPQEKDLQMVRSSFVERLKRLEAAIRESSRIALCFDTERTGAVESISEVRDAIRRQYGEGKKIDCYVWEFNAQRFETIRNGDVTCFRFTHPRHLFMYSNKSFEFEEMDNWVCSTVVVADYRAKGNYIYIVRNSKGVKLWFFRKLKKIINIAVSFLNVRVELCVGGR